MTGPDTPSVTVVILTWNSMNVIERCLSSIPGSSRHSPDVIVVDNGSSDGTPEHIGNLFPEVTVLRNSSNRGVAPARNQGLQQVTSRFALLLDADAALTPGALDVLTEVLHDLPDAGVVGPRLESPDGALQLTCRRFPTALTKVLRRVPGPTAQRHLRHEQYRDWDHSQLREVDYVIGACQLIRMTALRQVGFLDERMFYGPEDVDLCLRLRLAGWKTFYQPSSRVVHDEQRITRRNLLSSITWRHSMALARYFLKHRYLLSRKAIYRKIEGARERV